MWDMYVYIYTYTWLLMNTSYTCGYLMHSDLSQSALAEFWLNSVQDLASEKIARLKTPKQLKVILKGPSVVSWFLTPSNYRYIHYKPQWSELYINQFDLHSEAPEPVWFVFHANLGKQLHFEDQPNRNSLGTGFSSAIYKEGNRGQSLLRGFRGGQVFYKCNYGSKMF